MGTEAKVGNRKHKQMHNVLIALPLSIKFLSLLMMNGRFHFAIFKCFLDDVDVDGDFRFSLERKIIDNANETAKW